MPETLTFHFEGGLADDHKMNFYEAARFQYAAARLLVKLAQFRQTGKFVSKITNNSNYDIYLHSQTDGSFNINVSEPPNASTDKFVDLDLSNLVSYVSERVIEKTDEDLVIQSANAAGLALDGTNAESITNSEVADRTISKVLDDEVALSRIGGESRDIVERRMAELNREGRLAAQSRVVATIDPARDQKLISMAVPLIGEMATALRRSATNLRVIANNGTTQNTILYLDRRMAQQIETAKVDKEITPILGDIVQYNKESGWGKIRISDSSNPVISFSIPSDIKPNLQSSLMDRMKKDKVYVQAYFVRDKGNQPIRLIVVGILDTPVD